LPEASNADANLTLLLALHPPSPGSAPLIRPAAEVAAASVANLSTASFYPIVVSPPYGSVIATKALGRMTVPSTPYLPEENKAGSWKKRGRPPKDALEQSQNPTIKRMREWYAIKTGEEEELKKSQNNNKQAHDVARKKAMTMPANENAGIIEVKKAVLKATEEEAMARR
jgi:hypothetical protein